MNLDIQFSNMSKNLEDYIKVYDNWLDLEICSKTITDLRNNKWTKHYFYSEYRKESEQTSGDNELDVSSDDVVTREHIMQRIWDGYHRYITDLNFPWYDCWSGFSPVRFNRYLKDRVMAKHCDHITTLFEGENRGVPVLTALGTLNDDYKGGELVMFDNDVIPMKAGTLIIFPSNFLYPHKVTPVIEGERYSYVTWAW